MPVSESGVQGVTIGAAASRYVGGTTSGAPDGSAAALVGDFVIDQTGAVWVCTTAGTPGTWTQAGGGGTVTSVTAGDTSIVVGGSGAAPTIETGTLDVIATDHPPAASWSNNSHKITSVANGTAVTDAAAIGQVPASPGPGLNSLIAWAYDPMMGGTASGTIAIGGTLYLVGFTLPAAKTLTNIVLYITAGAMTPTSGESQVGIYNSSGSLVASATAAATATAITGTKTQVIALSSTYAAAAGNYWVGMVFQAATEPTLLRTATNNGDVANINLEGAVSTLRSCVNGAGITTALPSPSITLSSNTTTNSINYWAGVS